MDTKLHKIFKNITELDPPQILEKQIMKKIALKERMALKRRLAIIYAGFATTLGSFIWIISTFGKAVAQSDFWMLAKLVFSDTGLIFKNWGNFTFSLMETLPIFGIIAILVPVFILFILASEYLKTVNNNYKYI